MAKLLLNLRNVPDDEADDVREWLERERVEFYETPATSFGISAGGIWLRQDEDHDRAKALMASYQAGRRERAQADQATAEAQGQADTFATLLQRRPGYVLGRLAAIVAILALTLALPYLLIR